MTIAQNPKEASRTAAPFRLDRARLADLAETALAAARRAGASYADIRIGETRRQFIQAKEERLDEFSESVSPGFGLRVLVDGCWGFYGARSLEHGAIAAAVERAIHNARAVAPIRVAPVRVEETEPHEAEWIMPLGVDPFAVDAPAKVERLVAINAAALAAGADYCVSSFAFATEERLFADSRGSRIFQSRTRTQPSFEVTVVDKALRPFRDAREPRSGARRRLGLCALLRSPRRGAAGRRGCAPKAGREARRGGRDRCRHRPHQSLAHHSRDGRPFHRARSRARLGGEFRRHLFRQAAYARQSALRQRADDDQGRSLAGGRPRQHRLRRRWRAARARRIRDRLQGRVPQFSNGARSGASHRRRALQRLRLCG